MIVARVVRFSAAACLVVGLAAIALTMPHRFAQERRPLIATVLSEVAQPQRVAPASPPRVPPPRLADGVEVVSAPPPAPPIVGDVDLPVIEAPIWVVQPNHPERFYPRRAFLTGVEGRVELACYVEIDGRLDCDVASETPAGHGFGEAALALARAHVMRPALRDGEPVRARYRMIVPFATN
jgi:protein TonB